MKSDHIEIELTSALQPVLQSLPGGLAGSKFNLTEDAEPELLTHMGMSLAEANGDDMVRFIL